jgi:hypothetical protein
MWLIIVTSVSKETDVTGVVTVRGQFQSVTASRGCTAIRRSKRRWETPIIAIRTTLPRGGRGFLPHYRAV